MYLKNPGDIQGVQQNIKMYPKNPGDVQGVQRNIKLYPKNPEDVQGVQRNIKIKNYEFFNNFSAFNLVTLFYILYW